MTRGWKIDRIYTSKDSPIAVWRVYDPKVEGCFYIIMEEGELTFLEKIDETFKAR